MGLSAQQLSALGQLLPLMNSFHLPGSWLDQPSAGRCCGLMIVSLRSACVLDGTAIGLWSVGPLLDKLIQLTYTVYTLFGSYVKIDQVYRYLREHV